MPSLEREKSRGKHGRSDL